MRGEIHRLYAAYSAGFLDGETGLETKCDDSRFRAAQRRYMSETAEIAFPSETQYMMDSFKLKDLHGTGSSDGTHFRCLEKVLRSGITCIYVVRDDYAFETSESYPKVDT